MRFSAHGLSARDTYPCSKADVKASFGEGLLDGASFGIMPAFEFGPRYSPRPRILGTVILALSVHECVELISLTGRSSLYVYRVRKEEFDEQAHRAVVDVMRGAMRSWLEAQLDHSDTAVSGTQKLLVELRNGGVLLHETRYR